MTGFFARMGARALGVEGALRLRLPERYEGGADGWATPVPEYIWPVHEPAWPAAESAPGPERASKEPDPTRPVLPERTSIASGGGVSTPRVADAEPMQRAVGHNEMAGPAPVAKTSEARAHGPVEKPDPLATLPEGSPAARPDSPGSPAPLPQSPRPVRAGPAVFEPSDDAPASRSGPLPASAAPRPPTPARTASTLDLAELLRRHVLPTLTERAVIERNEVPVLGEPSSPEAVGPRPAPPPPAGTAVVRAGRMSVRHPGKAVGAEVLSVPGGESGEVHVHIDRVTVTRAPAPVAPVPSAPTAKPRPRSDHAAYLARRRELQ